VRPGGRRAPQGDAAADADDAGAEEAEEADALGERKKIADN